MTTTIQTNRYSTLSSATCLLILATNMSAIACSDENAVAEADANGVLDANVPPVVNDNGTVTETWSGYCTAVFTEDYVVRKFGFENGDILFTAKSGEEFLVNDIYTDEAVLLYLREDGAVNFDVNIDEETQVFPFSTQCNFDTATVQIAAFISTQFYQSNAFQVPLCTIAANSVSPFDNTRFGYQRGLADPDGIVLFEQFLGSYSSQCGNAESGFAQVDSVDFFGFQTSNVPLLKIFSQ